MTNRMQLLNLVILFFLVSNIGAVIPKDAILLSQVRTLTLYGNSKTSHRRVPAIPQLTCKGPGCTYYKVDMMRCKNQGSSYNPEDVEWSCTASLPPEFKLGSTDVICEGYSHRDDKYVLKGSCGVNYRLLFTDIGEEKYGRFKGISGDGFPYSTSIFTLVFLVILVWILYSAFRALSNINRPQWPGRFWGGGGDGGGGDPWDPPPPYSRKRQGQTAWEPGFWTGALGGAAAGYFAGNRNARQQRLFPERNSGWFTRNDEYFSDTNTMPNTMASGSSSVRHESTGFGSTSRR